MHPYNNTHDEGCQIALTLILKQFSDDLNLRTSLARPCVGGACACIFYNNSLPKTAHNSNFFVFLYNACEIPEKFSERLSRVCVCGAYKKIRYKGQVRKPTHNSEFLIFLYIVSTVTEYCVFVGNRNTHTVNTVIVAAENGVSCYNIAHRSSVIHIVHSEILNEVGQCNLLL